MQLACYVRAHFLPSICSQYFQKMLPQHFCPWPTLCSKYSDAEGRNVAEFICFLFQTKMFNKQRWNHREKRILLECICWKCPSPDSQVLAHDAQQPYHPHTYARHRHHVGALSCAWRNYHRCRQKNWSVRVNLPQPVSAREQQSLFPGHT